MQKSNLLLLLIGLGLSVQAVSVSGQILDQLFPQGNPRNTVDDQQNNGNSRFSNIFRNIMSSSMPGVYEVFKNGTSLGVNVLQGLVKVERGEEAERSGLQGPRPLSVRIFGMPVYERGVRVRGAGPSVIKPGSYEPAAEPDEKTGSEPKVGPREEEEELPIYRGEDSETAEWEREQMQRGTQSRHQKQQQSKAESNKNVIDATAVKKNIAEDIEKAEASMISIKKCIGSTKLELAKSEKKIDALKRHIESVEANNSIFEELGDLEKEDDILDFVEKYRHIIAKLPHDQREMIDLLEKRVKEIQPNMDIDQ